MSKPISSGYNKLLDTSLGSDGLSCDPYDLIPQKQLKL